MTNLFGNIEQLRTCPFCGKLPIYVSMNGYPANGVTAWVRCEYSMTGEVYTIGAWNTRPVEDALQSEVIRLNMRVDELNALVDYQNKLAIKVADMMLDLRTDAGIIYETLKDNEYSSIEGDCPECHSYSPLHEHNCRMATSLAHHDELQKRIAQALDEL